MWALNLQALQAFLFPRQGGEAADSTFSSLYPSSSIPPSPSVLFTLCSPAAVPPRRHSRPPRSWRSPRIGQWRHSPWEQREEVLEWVGEWCWRWLSGGDFFMLRTRQEGEGMITCGQALTFKIYRDAVGLCGQVTSYRAPPWKTKNILRRNDISLWLWRKLLHLSATQASSKNSFFLQIIPLHFVSALVGRRFSYHPT